MASSALEAWDVGYYSEKLREHRYAITQEELKPYFPVSRVLTGLFEVVRAAVRGESPPGGVGADLWHPDVRFYEIRDGEARCAASSTRPLRPPPQARRGLDGRLPPASAPPSRRADCRSAFLVCNFTPPVGDKPALLTHDEVLTLFHEFGHGLHHLLTRIDHPAVAGINGVEWDAVELPSSSWRTGAGSARRWI
jgi:oligopeptidase A